jgi:hypothetical protein
LKFELRGILDLRDTFDANDVLCAGDVRTAGVDEHEPGQHRPLHVELSPTIRATLARQRQAGVKSAALELRRDDSLAPT